MVVPFLEGAKNWQTLGTLWADTLSCNKKKYGQQNAAARTCWMRFKRRSITPLQNSECTLFPSGMICLCATPWESKQFINMALMRNLWNFSYFARRDISPPHSELCRCVSVSQAKHHVSFPEISLLRKLFSLVITLLSYQDVTWSSLFSGVKECGTKPAHNFLFPKSFFRIRRTAVLSILKNSALIPIEIRRSFLTKSATAEMFTAVRLALDINFSGHLIPAPFRLEI